MKRAVVFFHGDSPSEHTVKRYIREDDVIVCADGGMIWADKLGIKPDVYIGDLDSITSTLHKKLQKEKIEWFIYPKEKDETDSELVMRYVVEQGFTDITIFGWMGSRFDHVLANLFLLGNVKKNIQVRIVEEEQVLYLVKDKLSLRGKKGEFVSLIPLNGDVSGVSTKGLKWVLKNETLYYGKTRGVSNELVGKDAAITIKSGVLLVIQHSIK